MVVIAVLLVVLASLVTAGALFGSAGAATFSILGTSVTASGALVFLGGLVAGAAFLVGLALLSSGMKRGHRRRVELRRLRARSSQSVKTLEKEKENLAKEKEDLARRLERERGQSGRPAPA